MLLTDVVTASSELASTRSRKAKIDIVTWLVRTVAAAELEPVVAFLTGTPTQGRIGTGWRTLTQLEITPAAEPTLTVATVDTTFGEIAQTTGSGSSAARSDTLTTLLRTATAAEQRFLVLLLTGELRHGALEGVMLDAIAAASDIPGETVRRAFMLSGELGTTARAALTGGRDALERFRLEVARPVRPMLASPAESLDEAVSTAGPAVVEYKMDGARVQVHKSGDEIHVYTRTLREITAHVAELVSVVRALPCEQIVLDGETLALTDEGRPRPFQDTMSRFGSTRDEQVRALLLRPYFFDCLHLDGTDLLDDPLHARRAVLRKVVGEHLIPGETEPTNPHRILEAALRDGHEGVMVKSLDAPYIAGRRGSSWRKVKPVHTFDLVVLAAEWGHGRRTGYLSNLHLGARDPAGGPPIMVGKTFKGLTDELLAWQTEHLQRIETHRDAGTVHVRPEHVVEIELDGTQRSSRYPGGIALRFARVLHYRPDKDAGQADTIDTIATTLRGN